jgi:hypothetical protein
MYCLRHCNLFFSLEVIKSSLGCVIELKPSVIYEFESMLSWYCTDVASMAASIVCAMCVALQWLHQ